LHIEDFALHPRIHGNGYATPLWDAWMTLMHPKCQGSISIEVYYNNIEVWRKIMGVEIEPNVKAKIIDRPDAQVVFMTRNLKAPPNIVYKEWLHIQMRCSQDYLMECLMEALRANFKLQTLVFEKYKATPILSRTNKTFHASLASLGRLI
jgi:hypothetical protein